MIELIHYHDLITGGYKGLCVYGHYNPEWKGHLWYYRNSNTLLETAILQGGPA